jgi:hypothetical protein
MLGAGTVINPIIKIVTTVAVLAAVYFFMVKPILDTTDNAISESLGAFDSLDGFQALPGSIQSQIDEALEQTGSSDRLQDCIAKAVKQTPPDQARINRCVERFSG